MKTIVIGGPTAVGKSKLAIEIAKAWDAVIVSADAMTVYRDLDIGTAKPSLEELQEADHYCINIRDIDQGYSVGDFVEDVDRVFSDHPRVIIAGGTPYYLAALLRPMAPMPEGHHTIRAKLEKEPDLFARLQKVDPVIANRLHPNDRYRIIRALEVYEITGRPMSDVQNDEPKRKPLNAPVFWLSCDELRPRIGQRIDHMLEHGYLDECESIVKEGWDLGSKPLKSFSYRFFIQHILGNISLEEAILQTEIGTWHLARKQRTWSRNMGWKPIEIDVARNEIMKYLLTRQG
jgi:tRNA dimethylallyltransferase